MLHCAKATILWGNHDKCSDLFEPKQAHDSDHQAQYADDGNEKKCVCNAFQPQFAARGILSQGEKREDGRAGKHQGYRRCDFIQNAVFRLIGEVQ